MICRRPTPKRGRVVIVMVTGVVNDVIVLPRRHGHVTRLFVGGPGLGGVGKDKYGTKQSEIRGDPCDLVMSTCGLMGTWGFIM